MNIGSDVETHVLGLVVDRDGDRGLSTALRNLNGGDLRGEPASLCGSDGLLVGADAVLVLVLAREAVVVGALLTLQTHVLLLVCVGKTVLQDTINQRLVTKLGASPHVGKVVRSVRHALSTGSNNNVGIASDDGLRTDDNRLDRGGAHLVDGGGNGRLGKTSTDGALAGGVLTKAWICQYEATKMLSSFLLCGEDIANEDLLNILRLQAGAVDGSCAHVRQFVAEETIGFNIPLIAWEPSWIALRLERELCWW